MKERELAPQPASPYISSLYDYIEVATALRALFVQSGYPVNMDEVNLHDHYWSYYIEVEDPADIPEIAPTLLDRVAELLGTRDIIVEVPTADRPNFICITVIMWAPRIERTLYDIVCAYLKKIFYR